MFWRDFFNHVKKSSKIEHKLSMRLPGRRDAAKCDTGS